jgi:hypothetical protein
MQTPHRAGHRRQWSAERIEIDTAVGIRMVCGSERTTVSISKPSTNGTVHVECE